LRKTAKDQFPEELHNQILHASLNNGDFDLMVSDMCGQGDLNQGNSLQLILNCSSEEEINNLYKKLSDGGHILQELKEEFWGVDKFGVRWMLSFEKSHI